MQAHIACSALVGVQNGAPLCALWLAGAVSMKMPGRHLLTPQDVWHGICIEAQLADWRRGATAIHCGLSPRIVARVRQCSKRGDWTRSATSTGVLAMLLPKLRVACPWLQSSGSVWARRSELRFGMKLRPLHMFCNPETWSIVSCVSVCGKFLRMSEWFAVMAIRVSFCFQSVLSLRVFARV